MNLRKPLTLVLGALVLAVLLTLVVACDDDENPEDESTPPPTALSAERPDWFPASFPLPANTVVVSDSPSDGGGNVTFLAPVSFEQGIRIMDLNLESHGYVVNDRSVNENSAIFRFSSSDYVGSAELSPEASQTRLTVSLAPA